LDRGDCRGAGPLVLSAGGDRTLRAWDAETGKELRTFDTRVPDLTSVALAPDGKSAVSGGADGSLRTWDVASGKQVRRRDFRGSVLDVAFSRDGKWIGSAHREGAVRLWSPDLTETRTFRP
jgi:WD40 repeat protein